MKDSAGELGVIYALIERFEKQRLPQLLEIKKRVDKGGVFSKSDIQFMYQVTLGAQRSKRLIDRHPEWHKFCAEVIHLYEEVVEKSLENEKKSQPQAKTPEYSPYTQLPVCAWPGCASLIDTHQNILS